MKMPEYLALQKLFSLRSSTVKNLLEMLAQGEIFSLASALGIDKEDMGGNRDEVTNNQKQGKEVENNHCQMGRSTRKKRLPIQRNILYAHKFGRGKYGG